MPLRPFTARLQSPAPVILDGATGTELQRRGVSVEGTSWSARALVEAPDVVRQIHADYVAAGAEVIISNTFRTHARSLESLGWEHRAAELTRTAVDLARQAAGDDAWVAGSLAPLEDCYSPHLVPDDDTLFREYRQAALHLADAGVVVIWIETQTTLREAIIAAEAAAGTGLPFVVSFVCGPQGRLLSGESLGEAVRDVVDWQPSAVLINCLPPSAVDGALRELFDSAGSLPVGVYPNVDERNATGMWSPSELRDPTVFAERCRAWVKQGARLIGGCCGTTPAHIAALAKKPGF